MKTSKTHKSPFLSVIVPIYNEEKRLFNIMTIFNYLKHKKFSSEVILVNDGSKDNSLELAQKIKKQFGKQNFFRLISYEINKGKGFAVKTGMLKAMGNYCLFTDIDLSTPMDQFDKFLPYLKKFDILIVGALILKVYLLLKNWDLRLKKSQLFGKIIPKLK